MCEVCFGKNRPFYVGLVTHPCWGVLQLPDDGYPTPPHRSPAGAPYITLVVYIETKVETAAYPQQGLVLFVLVKGLTLLVIHFYQSLTGGFT